MANDPDDSPHNPHDNFVKRIFSDKEAARAELRQVLPTSLTEQLDWSTLRVESGSFVDPELRYRTSDLLYSIGLKGSDREVSVYVVAEHQSTPEVVMAARFVIYVGRLCERLLRGAKNAKTIPLVVPLLLHQGPAGSVIPRKLSKIIDVPGSLAKAFTSPIELEFIVDDLERSAIGAQVTRDQLVRDRGLALAEMARTLMWLHRRPDATDSDRAFALSDLRNIIIETYGSRAMRPFLVYFIAVFGHESPVRAMMLNEADEETGALYTTIRDELIAKGIAKGRTQGIAEGEVRGAAQMLERLLDARGVSLTDALRRRILECTDSELLQRWFGRAVTATTTAEVFDD